MSDTGNNPQPNWTEGLAPELRTHAHNRGLHEKSPAEAAALMLQAHQQAMGEITRLHNVTDAVRIPQNPDDKAGWDALYKRLGRPDAADGYKIEGLRFADGQAPDDAFLGQVRQIAFDLNLPADAAAKLAAGMMTMADADEHTEREARTGRENAAEAELRRAWGPQHDYFNFQVGRAMDLLGMDNGIAQMARAAGPEAYVKFMQGMRGLAAKMGEASMLRNEGGGPGGRNPPAYTPEQAQARINELKGNTAWVARWGKGDPDAVQELADLTRVIVAARNPNSAPAANFR